MKALAYPVAAVPLTGALSAQQSAPAPRAATPGSSGLTVAEIEKPSTDSWPTSNGDYTGRRFSSLTKINASNVKHLSLGWIVSNEYIKTNWSLDSDAKGQPIPNPEKRPQIAGALVTPNQGGATNWYPPSFSPQTDLFYVNATRAFSVWYIYDPSDNPMGWGGTDRGGYAEQPQLKAIDYKTGRIRWSVPRYGGNSGILTTAGNVLFNAAASGIGAYNATTGEPLWNARIGNSVTNGPITYELDGLQYVIAGAGSRLVAFVLNP